MPTKNEIIGNVYKKFLGSRAQTLDRIKSDDKKKIEAVPPEEPSGITKQDVDNWFLNNSQLAPALKAPYKTKFNSFVAPEPKHTFQIDLFNFKYEQKVNFKKNPPPRSGLMCVDVFTKEVHVVPMKKKNRFEWMDAIEKCLVKMGRPKIIMTDPDSSVTSVEMDEWFKRNKDIRHVLTRRHAAFAERALRDFKLIMTKMVKKEVKRWTEYLDEVLDRMNSKKQSNEEEDDKIYPHKATEFPPNEAAKPENWFEVHNNLEIHAKHNRKYPDLKVGDKVKVYRAKGALGKEDEGDYRYHSTVIKRIERSLGQTFYKVDRIEKPFLRSDILLIKEGEEGAAAAEPAEEEEPYVSWQRKRIRQREKNKELRADKAKAAVEAKAAVAATRATLKEDKAREKAAKARPRRPIAI